MVGDVATQAAANEDAPRRRSTTKDVVDPQLVDLFTKELIA